MVCIHIDVCHFHALRRPTNIACVTWNPATKIARLLLRNKCWATCVSWPSRWSIALLIFRLMSYVTCYWLCQC